MKHVSQAVKVGILFIVMVAGSYGVWKTIGERASGASDYQLWAHFKDASGLPEGSRVVIAGLPVGEISKLAIDGRYAKLTMRLREGVLIYDDAVAMKKSSSLLGDYYIEIDPGTPYHVSEAGQQVEHELLGDGAEIEHVVEATTPDELMRNIDEALPKVNELLESTTQLSEDLRALVNGPVKNMADRLERLVLDESERLEVIFANIEAITRDLRSFSGTLDEKTEKILDQVDKMVSEGRELVASTRTEIEQTGTKVREKLDLFDEVIENSSSITRKIDENEGTLGRLVNDPTIADNVEDITTDVKGFVATLFGMQTFVGLRTEYFIGSRASNNYLSIELHTRPGKFYLIEFNRGPRGKFPEAEIVLDPVNDVDGGEAYERRITIRDGTRVTFQFAKRIDWLTFRFGIKESTGGIGFDGQWFDDRLKLSMDVYDMSFNDLPRVKVAAAFEMFAHLYVLGGIDDAFNSPVTLQFEDPEGFELFEEVRFGRDWFVGGMVQFNDLDLTALLTIGSGILLAAAE